MHFQCILRFWLKLTKILHEELLKNRRRGADSITVVKITTPRIKLGNYCFEIYKKENNYYCFGGSLYYM